MDRYCELVPGFKPRKVSTPFLPELVRFAPETTFEEWDLTLVNDENKQTSVGQLQPIAAQVLVKILCAARVARLDLLRAFVPCLARRQVESTM